MRSGGLLAETVYGTKGIAAAANHPGERAGAASWIDASGDLWLFGGSTASFVLQVDGTSVSAAPQELWRQAAPDNVPSARSSAGAWMDKGGDKLWLFGGYGGTGDLWTYQP